MKFKLVAFWTMLFIALFTLLQTGFANHFYYVEQSQLFLFSKAYVMDELLQVGGLSSLIAKFLVQFFIQPYAGAAIVSALLIAVGVCTMGVLKRLSPHSRCVRLSLLPSLALLCVHFDTNYRMQGTVSYLFLLLSLYGYLRITGFRTRLIVGCLWVPLLYGAAGPVAVLLAGLMALCEFLQRTPKAYLSLLVVAEALLLAILAVYFSELGAYRFSFGPDLYYHHKLVPRSVLYFAWAVLPLLLLGVSLFRGRAEAFYQRRSRTVVSYLLQGGIVVGLSFLAVSMYGERKLLKLKELDYYTRTEQWDRILEACQGKQTNYLYLCYLNNALANRGELADRMFYYNQMGMQGLLVPWNKQEQVSWLLSDIYFTMGAIASSQEMAFEAYVSAMEEGNPRMLKRLVQTNLILGAYPVAEKYIAVLEQTWGYRQWATSQRKFLYNDDAVAQDSLLGSRRRMLPPHNTLTVLEELPDELEQMIASGTGNTATLHYLGAIYLLSKELDKFKKLVENYYGTALLPVLPLHFQEAVIVLSEKDSDYWKRFQLSEALVARFAEYKKQVLAHRNNPSVAGLLNRSYGNSYWFYYMFK